jgi:predicted dehydrogenase
LDWYEWLSVAPDRPYHPLYVPGKWRDWHDFGGGTIGDMGCHICDAANWALRLYETGPTSVEALVNEGMTDENYPTSERIRWEFPARGDLPPVTAYWHDGGLGLPEIDSFPDAKEFTAGLNAMELDSGVSIFVGDKGVATMGGFGTNPRLFPDERMADYEFPEKTIPRVPEMNPVQDWIDSIKNDGTPSSNFDISGPLTEWVNLGNLSLFHQGKLQWDSKNLEVTNRRSANEDVTREYRDGWDPKQFV